MRKLLLLSLFITGCSDDSSVVYKTLVNIQDEETIEYCDNESGTVMTLGLDLNHNSTLENNEILDIFYFCDTIKVIEVPPEGVDDPDLDDGNGNKYGCKKHSDFKHCKRKKDK